MIVVGGELTRVCDTLKELNFPFPIPTVEYYDNQVAMKKASNPLFQKRSKHIEIDSHVTKEKKKNGLI